MNTIALPDKREEADPSRSEALRLHVAALDGVRGVAALFVVIHHAYIKFYDPTAAYAPYLSLLLYGGASVSIFIVLSGFCLYLPVIKSNGRIRGGYGGFLVRRCKRILPPYYAALVFSLVAGFMMTGRMFEGYPVDKGLWSLAHHLFLIHNIAGNSEHSIYGDHIINGVMWTIAVEFQIYFWFPLFVRLANRFGELATLAVVAAAAFALQHVVTGTIWMGVNGVYYVLFCAGMLAAKLATRAGAWRSAANRLVSLSPWIGLVATVGYVLLVGFHAIVKNPVGFQAISGVLGFAIVLAAATNSSWRALFSHAKLVTLGEFSYSLYLIHMPLILLLAVTFALPIVAGFGSLAVIGFMELLAVPLIVLISHRFWHYFERPFMNTGPRVQPGHSAGESS